MDEHFKLFHSEMVILLNKNEQLKQSISKHKIEEKLQQPKDEEHKYKTECEELARKLFKLADICHEIPILESRKIELTNCYEALEKESENNLEDIRKETDSLRRKKEENFKQIYEEKCQKMELEITRIRDILSKSNDQSFQEQELERARDLELMHACHARELEHEKAHHNCQAKIRQLELHLQDLKKRFQSD